MSDADRDALIWQEIGGEPEELQNNGQREHIDSEFITRTEFKQFADRVFSRLHQLETTTGESIDPDAPVLVYYANMPEKHHDNLETSKRIAVTLHNNWRDIAWQLGGGTNVTGDKVQSKVGVDTKTKANAKYNPSLIRHRLKIYCDRDFQMNEVYRGLRQLAKLSGGTEHVDGVAGRVRITGGLYEYQERATADGKDVRRVLWRTTE